MRKQLHIYQSVLLAFFMVILVSACAIGEQATPVSIPTPTFDMTVPLGYPGHPVITNAEWSQIIQTFDGVDMLLVPTGCFMMGSTTGDLDEQPIHPQCF